MHDPGIDTATKDHPHPTRRSSGSFTDLRGRERAVVSAAVGLPAPCAPWGSCSERGCRRVRGTGSGRSS